MVKGSIDYLGVNQYTAYYMYDPKQPKQNVTDYQMDWNTGFACKLLYAFRLTEIIIAGVLFVWMRNNAFVRRLQGQPRVTCTTIL